jgi:hypothetical protein
MSYQLDPFDKGLLVHIIGNYKGEIQNRIDNPNFRMSREDKELIRLQTELEIIERASEIVHSIP